MIRTICAVLMLMCTLPCLAEDGAATHRNGGRPRIRLTPSAGPGAHLFLEGVEMSLAVNVPPTGSESKWIRVVTYLVDGRPVARSMKSPYIAVWKPKPGKYVLRAKASYVDGAEALSEPMTVMVAKQWTYPSWVRFEAISPYGSETVEDDGDDLPPPEECKVPGAAGTPDLTILPCERPKPSTGEREQLITSEGGFSAYRVTGDVPKDGASLTLPVMAPHSYDIEYLSILYYDEDTRWWRPLPSELHLDDDFLAVLTAKIDRPGIYSTGVLETLIKGRERDEYDVKLPIIGSDTKPPDAAWILPEEGAEISGKAELLMMAADNVGVYQIEFYLVNPRTQDIPEMRTQSIGDDMTDMDGQWSIGFDFSDYAPGEYVLKAVAMDVAGNSSTAVRPVTLNTSASAPRLTVDKPHYDDKIGGVVLTGTASDADGDTVRLLIGMIREDEEPFWLAIWPREDDKWGIVLPLVSPGENRVTVLAGDEHNITSAEVAFTAPLYEVEVFSVWPLGPQLEGAEVSLTGQASGGTGPIEYKFEASDGTGWTTVRDYATEPSCTWITGPPATYTLRVTARDLGDHDSVFTDECEYTIAEPLSGVSLGAEPAGPQPLGAQMLLTATPAGGADPMYEVEVYDGQEWTPLPWEDEWDGECKWNQWFWKPDSPGTYKLRVTARESETAAPTFSGEMTYTITPAKGKDGKR